MKKDPFVKILDSKLKKWSDYHPQEDLAKNLATYTSRRKAEKLGNPVIVWQTIVKI